MYLFNATYVNLSSIFWTWSLRTISINKRDSIIELLTLCQTSVSGTGHCGDRHLWRGLLKIGAAWRTLNFKILSDDMYNIQVVKPPWHGQLQRIRPG